MRDGKYCFNIQISNPQLTYDFSIEDETIYMAIESIFPSETEDAIIEWNYICIRVGYKYGVSYLYDDFRQIVNFTENNSDGIFKVTFADNNFFAEWNIKVDGSKLVIDSKWFNITGNIEDILNQRTQLIIEKEEFLKELKKLIRFVDKCLIECGYKNLLISLYGEQSF